MFCDKITLYEENDLKVDDNKIKHIQKNNTIEIYLIYINFNSVLINPLLEHLS